MFSPLANIGRMTEPDIVPIGRTHFEALWPGARRVLGKR
jgi:hypothetical protein